MKLNLQVRVDFSREYDSSYQITVVNDQYICVDYFFPSEIWDYWSKVMSYWLIVDTLTKIGRPSLDILRVRVTEDV